MKNEVSKDRVYEEIGRVVLPELFRVLEPFPKLAWTKRLAGYEEAQFSAENAKRKLFAATDAVRAGFDSESPILDVCLYKVRAGLIQVQSAEVSRAFRYAQHINKAKWFIKRLNAEVNNAQKRVPDAPPLNVFRSLIVEHWLRYGFWLMPDDLIARVATTIKLKPDGCNRQTITRAVKELALVKHPETGRSPIVKGLGEGGVFIFREGYPLRS